MKRIKVSFIVNVPDNITDGMLLLKYDSETIERELTDFLGDELGDDDEISVENIAIFDNA